MKNGKATTVYGVFLVFLVGVVVGTLSNHFSLQDALWAMTGVATYINEMKRKHEATLHVQVSRSTHCYIVLLLVSLSTGSELPSVHTSQV